MYVLSIDQNNQFLFYCQMLDSIKNNINLLLEQKSHNFRTSIINNNIQISISPQLTRYDLTPSIQQKKKLFHPRRSALKPVDIIGKYKQNKKFKKLFEKLKSLIPLQYRQQYNFQENWQTQKERSQFQNTQTLLSESNIIVVIIQTTLLLFDTFLIWYFSLEFFFGLPQSSISFTFYCLFLISIILQICLQLNKTTIVDSKMLLNRNQIFKNYMINNSLKDVICIVSSLVQIFSKSSNKEAFALVSCIILLIKISEKYNFCRQILIDGRVHEKKYNLFELFIYMLALAHFFGCALYYVTTLNISQKSWIQDKNLQNAPWQIQYIYAFYWASTTMVTVGFGDITPQNEYQVLVIMMVEFLGVAMFGYVINVIGCTISQIKQSSERISEQIKTVSRISRCFGLNGDLSYRIKQFIRNTHKARETFSIAQQKQMIDKLSDNLQQEIIHQTNIKVLKKNIFFISTFTKAFQDQIALKLTKRLFQPDEQIIFDNNNKSLLIIEQGELKVYYIKKNQFRQIHKLVNSISILKERSKIYGYTEFVTERKTNLQAISSSITVAYELKKTDFMQLLSSNPRDYQTYIELRDIMDENSILESIEAPSITDSRKHYLPNKRLISKKHAFSKNQPRKYYCQRRLRSKNISNRFIHCQTKQDFAALFAKKQDFDETGSYYQAPQVLRTSLSKEIKQQTLNIITQSIKSYQLYKRMSNFQNIKNKYQDYLKQRILKNL